MIHSAFNPISDFLSVAFQSVATVSLIGSFIVIIAICLHTLLGKRVSPQWMCVLWMLVMLRFVLFAAPQSPTSFENLLPAKQVAESVRIKNAAPRGRLILSNQTLPTEISQTQTIPVKTYATGKRAEHNFRITSKQVWICAAIIWCFGAIFMLARLILGYRSIRLLVSRSSEAPEHLDEAFEQVKHRLEMRSNAILRISDEVNVPSMTGLFRPVVLLPQWCDDELSSEQLQMVFAHELVHIRRFDAVAQLFNHLIAIVHWFNPIVRAVATLQESCRELACDNQVLELMCPAHKPDDQADSTRRAYGQTILEIAARGSKQVNKSLPTSAMVSGFIQPSNNLIKQRIAMVVHKRSPQRFGSIVTATLLVLLMAFGYTKAQTTQSSESQTLPNPPVVEIDSKLKQQPAVSSKTEAPSKKLETLVLPAQTEPTPVVRERIHRIKVNGSKRIRTKFPFANIVVNDPRLLKPFQFRPTKQS